MSHKRIFQTAFLLTLAFLFSGYETANACSCGPTPNVLESYEGSDQVVILKALSVEKAKEGEKYFVDGVKSTKMLVEKVYKGTLKVGDEITFRQGGGADCIWTFNEKSVGREYLFYLYNPENGLSVWEGIGCGRSIGLADAGADLSFLNNLDKLLGKTRISGKFECWPYDCPSLAERKVRIIAENKKVYALKTNKDGEYEIYDLPAGKYIIEPEIPEGWKVSNFYLRYNASYAGNQDFRPNDKPQKQFPIILEDKKHAELDFHFEIDNAIRGRLLGPDGKPMKDICITAVSTEATTYKYGPFDCTDENGRFLISELYQNSYVLVINGDREIRASQPIKMLFYPGVSDRSKATIIDLLQKCID